MYNQDAIREPHVTFTEKSKMKGGRNHFGKINGIPEKGKNGGKANLHTGRWDQAFHPLGRNKRTVWEIPLGKFRGEHFAVFPEKLVETCLFAGSNRGSLVCDPFMGSGTTGVVAVREGRDFIGIDISTEYVEMARERVLSTSGTLGMIVRHEMDADVIIARYAMKPHSEGGFYAETYRSAGLIPGDALSGFTGARAYCTAILYLLRESESPTPLEQMPKRLDYLSQIELR